MDGWLVYFYALGLAYVLRQLRARNISTIVFFLLISITFGLRLHLGFDYDQYLMFFEKRQLETLEPIWRVVYSFAYGCRNFQVIIFISSVFIYCLLIRPINVLSDNAYISLLVFCFFPSFFLSSLAIIRQYLAISVLIYGIYLRTRKNRTGFLICLIIAPFSHFSILFVYPFLIVLYKRGNIWSFLLAFMSIFSIKVILTAKIPFLALFLGSYGGYVQKDQFVGVVSSGVVQLVMIALTLFLYLYRNEAGYGKSEFATYIINASIFGLLIYSTFFTLEVIRRISLYFIIFLVFALPRYFYIGDKKTIKGIFCRLFVISFVIFCFLLFCKDVFAGPLVYSPDSKVNKAFPILQNYL
jgi:hypothetical protein